MDKIHQPKYAGTFEDKLHASKSMEYAVIETLRDAGFFVRQYDEGQPFRNHEGHQRRLCDIEFFKEGHMMLFGECKDYCRMIYYNATGAPSRYIKKLSIVNPDKLIMFFKDNMELIRILREQGKQYHIDAMLESGTILPHPTKPNEFTFVPYGHFLSELMKAENRRHKLEKKIVCKLSAYNGEPQYIWDMNAMLPLPKLINHICDVVKSGSLITPK